MPGAPLLLGLPHFITNTQGDLRPAYDPEGSPLFSRNSNGFGQLRSGLHLARTHMNLQIEVTS